MKDRDANGGTPPTNASNNPPPHAGSSSDPQDGGFLQPSRQSVSSVSVRRRFGPGAQVPSEERAPYVERARTPEKEHTSEVPMRSAPTPESRKPEDTTEEIASIVSAPERKSRGRVVDARMYKEHEPVKSIHSLTDYADKKEGEFIEGVKTAHGSDKS